jgi:hypothetical protein
LKRSFNFEMAPLKPQRAIKEREREREREREKRGKEGKMKGGVALSKAWKTVISEQSDFVGQKFNKLGKQFRQWGRRIFFICGQVDAHSGSPQYLTIWQNSQIAM